MSPPSGSMLAVASMVTLSKVNTGSSAVMIGMASLPIYISKLPILFKRFSSSAMMPSGSTSKLILTVPIGCSSGTVQLTETLASWNADKAGTSARMVEPSGALTSISVSLLVKIPIF